MVDSSQSCQSECGYCRHCKWWQLEAHGYWYTRRSIGDVVIYGPPYGTCLLSVWSDGRPLHEEALLAVRPHFSRVDAAASVVTAATFGCVQFAAKEVRSGD